MKTTPAPQGLRILVVEDETDTAESLAFNLRNRLPKSDIVIVGTIADGIARLDETQTEEKPRFDVAILDFKLPPKLGEQPEPDCSLGGAFRDFSPETIIIQVTSHPDDPLIRRQFQAHDACHTDSRMFVAKDSGWIERVFEDILRGIHTRRIREKFDDLFGREITTRLQRTLRRRHAIGRCDRMRTLDVATLCADAGRHWEYLSDSLKADLERVLGHAQDEAGNHYVGVVGPPPPLEPGEQDEVEI